MLVLTRKVGESITIGDDISVRVLEVNGQNIKLGINAPRSVSIHRQEIYDKIKEENISSVQSSPSELLNAVKFWQNKSKKG